MKVQTLIRYGVFLAGLTLGAGASADAVTDWNDTALRTILAVKPLPMEQARALTLVHVAMFDAVNAIERRYRPYVFNAAAPAGAAVDAAAASAARAVLLKLYPDQQDAIEINYVNAIAALPEGDSRTAGIDVGERAAAAVLASPMSETAPVTSAYRPYTTPGVYVPTTLPIGLTWAQFKPFALRRASQFRPAPPPSLKGPRWARDYNEVKQLGAKASSVRTPEQTDVAFFWIMTGPASWNPIIGQLAAAKKLDVVANARLFALANIAASDALIAVFDAKYAHNFWRPITAIRNGDLDGNDATVRDAGWLSLIEAPLHPEYPCAHCTTAGAVGAVLESEFGTATLAPFAMTSPTAPGITRTWTRIPDWVTEIDNARIWGGIHYRNSTEVGETLGREIGRYTVANFLQPMH
jgi:hypothetical protein